MKINLFVLFLIGIAFFPSISSAQAIEKKEKKKLFALSTRLGLSSIVEGNLYVDIPIDEGQGLLFGVGVFSWGNATAASCGQLPLAWQMYFAKDGFYIKGGYRDYSPNGSVSILLDYRYGEIPKLRKESHCDNGFPNIIRSNINYQTNQIGIMHYVDRNIFGDYFTIYAGLGLAANFVKQTILTENNRVDRDIYMLVRLDFGFRLSLWFKK